MNAETFIFSTEMSPLSSPALLSSKDVVADLPLTRRDILAFESLLRDDIAAVLPFEAHALYFPMENEVDDPAWIADEGKLLLPLKRRESHLGVLLLRNPDRVALEPLLSFLPAIVSLCLDKLALYKWGRSDSLTGLAAKHVLLERLAREMGQVRRDFAAGPEMEASPERAEGINGDEPVVSRGSYQGTLGIIVLRLTRLRGIARAHGHGLSEKLMRALGAALRDVLPEQALGARTGDEELAVLMPGVAPQGLEQLARDCVYKLNSVRLQSRLTGTQVHIEAHAGFALFPQDWEAGREGREGHDLVAEAESLFDKSRLAGFRAGEMGRAGDGVLGYASILPRGGIIDSVLPLSRAQTTLGRDVGAREGQRFTVWSVNYPVQSRVAQGQAPLDPMYKGEIVLADVREDKSQADILLLGDPAWPLEPGDRLNLIEDDYSSVSTKADRPGRVDPLTGLYRHGDFLARLAVARGRSTLFGLVLARFHFLPPVEDSDKDIEHSMGEAAALLRHLLAGRANSKDDLPPLPVEGLDGFAPRKTWPFEEEGSTLLAGRYSLNSILLFHPGLSVEDAHTIYDPVSREMRERLGIEIAMGVACLPWLAYRAADAVECCRKALEYAMLLPPPHVGIFDSLAINISADKRYSQGDVFGAIEEYRLALLADENNTLAWNSLGVCLSGVGRHGEARRAFEHATRRNPRDAAVHYNLGTTCISTGDISEAIRQFRVCLDLEPGYTFADIKLGELAEHRQSYEEARQHYELAQKSDPASPVPYRCLARLDLLTNKPEKARERLHQALLRNPQDAFSLHMMACLYLDGDEDPELAETLARQSVALRPDRKVAWLELARALEKQGRHRDARDARVQAGNL